MRNLIIGFLLINAHSIYGTECKIIAGSPSLFMISKFVLNYESSGTHFDFTTTKGRLTYQNVECYNENLPDPVLSCEGDDFVMIMSTDENPQKAVINPFVFKGKEYGPFFFQCSN